VAIIKEVAWNDGEGITDADLNNMQRFARAQASDFWMGLARIAESDILTLSTMVYAHGNGGAVFAHADARKLANIGGWIAVNRSTGIVTGDEPEFLCYYLATSELNSVLDVGDATHPRYDLLCIAVDYVNGDSESRDFKDATTGLLSTTTPNKRRNMRLQFQIVKGTAAASPVEPAIPAGYVKMAAVYVPATWNAVIDPANILDYRMPIGFKLQEVGALQFDFLHATDSVTPWYVGEGTIQAFTAAIGGSETNPRNAYALCNPGAWMCGRVVRVGYGGQRQVSSTGTLDLVRVDAAGGSYSSVETVLSSYSTASLLPAAHATNHQYAELSLLTGPPIWANGHTNGYAMLRTFAPPFSSFATQRLPRLALKYRTDGTRADRVNIARFYVAMP
jgi:hypothetical protein